MSEYDRQYVLGNLKREPFVGAPETEDGMPVDRTICPACVNQKGAVQHCQTCSGTGAVCPKCRGARVVMVPQGSDGLLLYQQCPKCCDPQLGPDGWPAYKGRWPLYTRNVNREYYAILDYRDEHQGAADDDGNEEPF